MTTCAPSWSPAPARAFCAGADLSAGAETFDHRARGSQVSGGDLGDPRIRDRGGLVTLRIFRSLKPVIAAVNGPAVGIGVTMQLAMDFRLASDTARFGFVFARRGIVPEAASSWFLPRIVGLPQALEWCLTGRVFAADEALKGGLVRSVHAPEELLGGGHCAGARNCRQYGAGFGGVDAANAVAPGRGARPRWRHTGWTAAGFLRAGTSEDAAEGVMSFLQKRPPVFPGTVSRDMPGFYPWWIDEEYR